MAGVGGVMKLVKQLLNSWKVGKCSELKLICEDGVMKVTMFANLGAWVQPIPKVTGDRGYQGSRRRASPSYLRRQERRAAERAASSPAPPAAAAEEGSAAPKPGRFCKKCGQPCLGHKGPTGEKCGSTLPSPEKVRGSSPALSLQVTPGKEDRAEDCQNCGAVMSPSHQCDETEVVSETEDDTSTKIACVKMCHNTNKRDKMWCSTEDANCWCETSCEDQCDCDCEGDENEKCYFLKKARLKF